VDTSKFQSKSAKSVKARIGNIRALLKEDMDLPAFWTYLKRALAGGGMAAGSLTPEELAAVKTLEENKYDTWEWNFGKSPKYNMTNKRRFDGGSLEPKIAVEKGQITDAVFYGDFLAVCPLDEVTEALRGCAFRREDVAAVLERFELKNYFGTISEEEILETIFHVD